MFTYNELLKANWIKYVLNHCIHKHNFIQFMWWIRYIEETLCSRLKGGMNNEE
jgi:hypothetical protein